MGDELVTCHSGYQYAQRPAALHWEGDRLEVEQIEAEWRTPGGKHFRVRVWDGRLFELTYDELGDEWIIAPV